MKENKENAKRNERGKRIGKARRYQRNGEPSVDPAELISKVFLTQPWNASYE